MKNKKMDFGMAEKAMEGTSVGQALKGGMKLMGAMNGCSNENPMGDGGEIEIPMGTKMCYVVGSQTIPVVTLQDVYEGQSTAVVQLPDGRKNNVDVEYLLDEYECRKD